MDPLVKIILNSLKCPICQSQIDLLDWKDKRQGKHYNFGCVNNWEHYRLFLVHWEPVLRVEYETVVVYEGRHKYEVSQSENNVTDIFIYNVDPEGRVIEQKDKPGPSSKFSYNKKLFDFSNTNREKVVNRVKTILVFQ